MKTDTEFEETLQKIKENAKYLKLPYSYHNFRQLVQEHINLNSSIVEFYNDLFQKEADVRNQNGKENRIRHANFPYKKYLSDLDVSCLPEDAQNRLQLLKTLDFVRSGQNIILAGNPGTGKTHIAIGLGIEACKEGFRVLFTSAPTLVHKLKECKSNRTLTSIQRQFEMYDLIILDELRLYIF